MANPTVYIEFAFIKYLYERASSALEGFLETDDKQKESIISFYKDLLSICILIMDHDELSFFKLCESDQIAKSIWKKYIGGGSKLYFCLEEHKKIRDNEQAIFENDPQAIYCLNEEAWFSNNWCNKFGVLCIGRNLSILENLVSPRKPVRIKIGDKIDWRVILPIRLPTSSAVIIDTYLLEESAEEGNLFSLLDCLIPGEIFVGTFSLTFIHFLENDLLVKKRQKEIQAYLTGKKIKFRIELLKGNKNDFHDRDILMNYLWVHSGNALNLSNKKKNSKKTTTIHFNTIMNGSEAIFNYINGLKNTFKGTTQNILIK